MGLSHNLPKDLITPANTPDLELMTHLFEKMTEYPSWELIALYEKRLVPPKRQGDQTEAKITTVHTCLVFPFRGRFAQAYDCDLNIALHVQRVKGAKDSVSPAYVPEQEFCTVAPFLMPTTLAITKEGNRPVIIDMSGKIMWNLMSQWNNMPEAMLKTLLN